MWALLGNAAVLGQPLLYWLVPAAVLGVWHARHTLTHRPALVYLIALYVAQSLLFPFQSVRGGLFHSLTALLPFLALWTVLGVEAMVDSASRRRRWRAAQAHHVFAVTVVAMGVVSSAYFLALQEGRWAARVAKYRDATAVLAADRPSDATSRVMAVDPPSFWYASGASAVAVPSDGFDALLAAAQQFDALYLVVEGAGPPYLASLWVGDVPVAGFACAGASDEALVYRVDPSRASVPTLCPAAQARAVFAAPTR
jgi:hypothetical protein